MTVEELANECMELMKMGLGKCKVVKSSDDEGNSFHYVNGIGKDYLHPFQDTYGVELICEEEMAEWIQECKEDGEEPPVFQPIGCIW